ncbi:putative low molecular weight protein-tyrosine-phosphatase slr0328 isoform X2 [Manihot esculenta]|uniref:acid phosphatase n=1 Tax=Manihot esculenta TaxID=3983 RepID=A0A2C9VYH7_MANES|nr:putative low molecular weight protein-tyrosine-phosphatase slr0328 isoform X2 [Manihot esculenta]OAY51437.1 hypothetical protein MANES_04G006800v8 [Manihot esculenta]
MMRAASSSPSAYGANTRLPTRSLNLQLCHIPLKVSFLSYPLVQNWILKSIPIITETVSTSRVAFSYPFRSFVIKASSVASSADTETKPFSVLFVCLGNICRSPAAEGIFRDIVKKRGLDSKFKIDSAGTIGYHEGNLADTRMRAVSKRRGVEITSLSRPLRPSDFRDFDIILAMDKQNREDIMEAFNRWRFRETLPDDAHKKVKLMCSYCKNRDETEVPDPYYGGPQGFEKVFDLLEDACESLLDSILEENSDILSS